LQLSGGKGTNWSASISVVFSENFLPHITKRSSIDGPSRSITIRLDLYSFPCQ
jgi:hypothetical protein